MFITTSSRISCRVIWLLTRLVRISSEKIIGFGAHSSACSVGTFARALRQLLPLRPGLQHHGQRQVDEAQRGLGSGRQQGRDEDGGGYDFHQGIALLLHEMLSLPSSICWGTVGQEKGRTEIGARAVYSCDHRRCKPQVRFKRRPVGRAGEDPRWVGSSFFLLIALDF